MATFAPNSVLAVPLSLQMKSLHFLRAINLCSTLGIHSFSRNWSHNSSERGAITTYCNYLRVFSLCRFPRSIVDRFSLTHFCVVYALMDCPNVLISHSIIRRLIIFSDFSWFNLTCQLRCEVTVSRNTLKSWQTNRRLYMQMCNFEHIHLKSIDRNLLSTVFDLALLFDLFSILLRFSIHFFSFLMHSGYPIIVWKFWNFSAWKVLKLNAFAFFTLHWVLVS